MSNGAGSIGLFDSGVGGLTVLRDLRRLLPQESTLYLGDNTRNPYGRLPVETIRQYTLQCLDYLYREGVKALVIACNTATAVALEAARERYDVPVIGVIGPTAETAAVAAKARVGVMATLATVNSEQYPEAIRARNPGLEVFQQECTLLTPLVESGEIGTRKSESVLDGYLQPLRQQRVDTVVLGCTHYPFLRSSIERLMGGAATIVESGPSTVASLVRLMEEGKLERGRDEKPMHRLLTTGNPETFGRLASRLWPEGYPAIETVDVERGHE